MLYEFVTAALAVLGVLSLVYWAMSLLFRPVSPKPLVILSQPKSADSLTGDAIHLEWLGWQGVRAQLWVDTGLLDEEGLCMAKLLAKNNRSVILCKTEDIDEYRATDGRNTFGRVL